MAFGLLAKDPPPQSRAPRAALVALLLLLSSVRYSSTANSSDGAGDRAALLSFKSLLSDPSKALTSWNETLDFCRWTGVTCGGGRGHAGRVTSLNLGDLYLAGTLSPSLANLTFLTSLRLPGNRLDGRIPAEFGRLSQLQHLDLSSNSLSGEIPANLLSNVTLRNNELESEIPITLGSLIELRSLNLGLNKLSGSIPASLGNLSTISVLILSDNMLEGKIPPELGGLASLRLFSVGRNNLSGEIPPSLFNLSSLEKIDANYNQLTGTLPEDIGHSLPRLQWFLMDSNLLEGPIPSSFPNASGLEYLEMKYNGFSGPFPSNLGTLQRLSSLMLGGNRLEGGVADGWSFLTALTNCSNLRVLDMGGNLLSGALPKTIGNLSRQLEALQTGASQISGAIRPPVIGNLVSLELLNIQSNFLTGSIPDTVGKLRRLRELTFAGNKLSGEIPSSISNLTLLTHLYLNNNELEGSIPSSLSACQNLLSLDLSVNNFSGTIPPGILSLPSLTIYLDLSRNSLSGPLPPDLGSKTKVGQIDISDNRLAGEIPSSLGDCSSLEAIFMEGNMFHGVIPESLSNLWGLRKMDLSRNNMSGSIPSSLGRLQFLERLNLSFNDFEGEMPRGGVFDKVTAISVSGNKRLCGGNPELRLPYCPLHGLSGKRESHRARKLLLPIIVMAAVLVIFLFLVVTYRRRRKGRTAQGSVAVPLPGEQHVKVSYLQLLRATEGFSAENLVGAGSFGTVYKGTLILNTGGHDDDVVAKAVAVKVFDRQEHDAAKNFAAECEALRSVRHRNLAKIITSCSSIDSNGHGFKALVFEFMPNGSLERWLHPPPAADDAGRQIDGISLRLTFRQRLDVSIDVASALDYLHNQGQAPIVHCDLKPSNVLLHSDMKAVVSDFGSARFLSRSRSVSSTQSSTAGIKGTIGYIAPEYGVSSCQASTLGDVYSYGILLLEMFTGRRPTEDAFGGDLSLRKHVEMAFPEQVMEIIDPYLLPPADERDEEPNSCIVHEQKIDVAAGRLEDCTISVFRVGLSCSNESPKARMEIRDVIKEMHMIKGMYMAGRSSCI